MTDTAANDTARAEVLVGQALAASPTNPLAHFARGQVLRFLASAYGLKGATPRASTELAEAQKLSPDRFSSLARLQREDWGVPSVRALFEATYFAGLRKAGMPEE